MQLPLSVQLQDQFSFDSYWVGNNELAVDSLKTTVINHETSISALNQFFVYAPEQSGKTHLLVALSKLAEQHGQTAYYIDLYSAVNLPVEILQGLSEYRVICIDNVHALSASLQWQVAIFDLINQLREQQESKQVIFSASCAPNFLQISLPDLRSRLNASSIFRLHALSHDDLLGILTKRFHLRGININEDTLTYIINRCERRISALVSVVDQLDHASLQAKRKITIPFVKQTLGT